MVIFKLDDLLKKNKMSRYKFNQLTEWNYKRIKAYCTGTVKAISVAEIEKICTLFDCEITDVIEFKK